MPSRFGVNAPADQPIEDTIRWAANNDFGYIDFQADLPPNALASFDTARVESVRSLCEQHGIQIGLHPSSAINNAEDVPPVSQAVDEYLFANLDLAARLGCGWMVGHGGYHFGDLDRRRPAAIDRIRRLVDRAEQQHVLIYLENHNKEPDRSEIHYLPHNVEETRWFFDAIQSSHLKWAFNAAHGNLVPEGWAGFLDAFGAGNIGQVRLNDNTGDYEIHLVPGEGTFDFEALFARLKEEGYTGPFSFAFGTPEDKIRVRDRFRRLL